jgi:D-serine deaminase-like pyridoxal phosphate-dependent protein
MYVDELDTPAVVIDLDIMDRNLKRLAEYTASKQLSLRPHTKTHKIPELAKLQIASGASGITVAKPGEARVMCESGVRDLLVAYPLVTETKAQRVAELAEDCTLSVSLDSSEAIAALGRAAATKGVRVGILIEIDVGFRRCGVATPEEAVRLAVEVSKYRQLDLRGIMFYPGHLSTTPAEQGPLIAEVNRTLERFFEVFYQARLDVSVVSGGSTATAYRSHEFIGVSEIRPGMYLLNDGNLVKLGVCSLDDCALHVHTTVVSTAVNGRAIVDGGSKTFSSDRARGDKATFGTIREDPDAQFVALSEEHGHLDISRSERKYRVGERLRILPNHVCATVNMHDQLYGVRNGEVERVWRVEARGKVQ